MLHQLYNKNKKKRKIKFYITTLQEEIKFLEIAFLLKRKKTPTSKMKKSVISP